MPPNSGHAGKNIGKNHYNNKKIAPKFNAKSSNQNNYGQQENYYDMDPWALDIPNEWEDYSQNEYYNYKPNDNRRM